MAISYKTFLLDPNTVLIILVLKSLDFIPRLKTNALDIKRAVLPINLHDKQSWIFASALSIFSFSVDSHFTEYITGLELLSKI